MPVENNTRTIAVVLYPGLTALDLVGPLQVLTALEKFSSAHQTVVVAERLEPMETDIELDLVADRTFEDLPHPYALVVPGGKRGTLRAMSDPAIRQYVQNAAGTAEIVASVCTGSLILAANGLLEGRPATTNWFWRGVLENLGATYERKRWVEEERLIMSAGVSAGIDMALYLISRLTDEATAKKVQLAVDYDPEPPFGGIKWNQTGLVPTVLRSSIGIAAPLIAARPKRILRRERRALANTEVST